MKERNSDGSEDEEEEDNLLAMSREESTGGTGVEGGERGTEVIAEAKISDLWDPKKPYLRNLLIMTMTWQALGFTYSLISFELKYLPGDIFSNSYTSAVAEIIAKLGAGVVLMRMGMKPLFAAAFFIAFIGAFNML